MRILSSLNTTAKVLLIENPEDLRLISSRVAQLIEDGAILIEGDWLAPERTRAIFALEDLREGSGRKVLLFSDPMVFPPSCLKAMANAWPETHVQSGLPEHLEAEAGRFLETAKRLLEADHLPEDPAFS